MGNLAIRASIKDWGAVALRRPTQEHGDSPAAHKPRKQARGGVTSDRSAPRIAPANLGKKGAGLAEARQLFLPSAEAGEGQMPLCAALARDAHLQTVS